MVRTAEKVRGSKANSLIKRRRSDDDDEDEKPRKKRVKDDDKVVSAKKVKDKATKDGKPDKPAKKKGEFVEHGIDVERDVRWNDNKVRLFKLLKKMGATSPKTAVEGREVVNRSNERLTPKDVRHYSYHARAKKDQHGNERRESLIDIANPEDGKNYRYYLTKAGQKIDPDLEYKKQEAAKDKD